MHVCLSVLCRNMHARERLRRRRHLVSTAAYAPAQATPIGTLPPIAATTTNSTVLFAKTVDIPLPHQDRDSEIGDPDSFESIARNL